MCRLLPSPLLNTNAAGCFRYGCRYRREIFVHMYCTYIGTRSFTKVLMCLDYGLDYLGSNCKFQSNQMMMGRDLHVHNDYIQALNLKSTGFFLFICCSELPATGQQCRALERLQDSQSPKHFVVVRTSPPNRVACWPCSSENGTLTTTPSCCKTA